MLLCPVCGEKEMQEWEPGTYECSNCGTMIPKGDIHEIYETE